MQNVKKENIIKYYVKKTYNKKGCDIVNIILGLVALILGGIPGGLIDCNIEGVTPKKYVNLFGVLGSLGYFTSAAICAYIFFY